MGERTDAWIGEIEEAEYHADHGRFSCSFLDLIERDPREAERMWKGKGERKATDDMLLGKYGHMRLLEPDQVASRVARAPTQHDAYRALTDAQKRKVAKGEQVERRPQDPTPAGEFKTMKLLGDENKRKWADFESSARGLTIVKPEFEPIIGAVVRAVANHPIAKRLLDPDVLRPEVSAHWFDDETGVPFKGRFDGITEAFGREEILEVKFTHLVDPSNIGKWSSMGWGRKAAAYLDAFKAARKRPTRMWWLFIEPAANDPRIYTCWVDEDSPFVVAGRRGTERYQGYVDLAKWAQLCIASDVWEKPWQRVKDASMITPDWFANMVERSEDDMQLQGATKVSNG